MPNFEILIPKSDRIPMDLRLRLKAESWIDALKAGLAKVGEEGPAPEGVLCDIKEDNSIHVTDTLSGRVFRIEELLEAPVPVAANSDEMATQPEMPAVTEEVPQPSHPTTPTPVPQVPPPAPVQPLPTAPMEQAPPAPTPPAEQAPPTPPPLEPRRSETASAIPAADAIGRSLGSTSEATVDLLEEIFEFTDKVKDKSRKQDALDFMLDLAMAKVPSDAGSVILADINTRRLEFGAAKGPKSEGLVGVQLKMGQGIVGFCAESSIAVAVSDAQRDPRFYSAISEKIGYPTRSILCVPMQVDGRVVGALELINKHTEDLYTERDLGIASFIAQQLARHLIQRGWV